MSSWAPFQSLTPTQTAQSVAACDFLMALELSWLMPRLLSYGIARCTSRGLESRFSPHSTSIGGTQTSHSVAKTQSRPVSPKRRRSLVAEGCWTIERRCAPLVKGSHKSPPARSTRAEIWERYSTEGGIRISGWHFPSHDRWEMLTDRPIFDPVLSAPFTMLSHKLSADWMVASPSLPTSEDRLDKQDPLLRTTAQ